MRKKKLSTLTASVEMHTSHKPMCKSPSSSLKSENCVCSATPATHVSLWEPLQLRLRHGIVSSFSPALVQVCPYMYVLSANNLNRPQLSCPEQLQGHDDALPHFAHSGWEFHERCWTSAWHSNCVCVVVPQPLQPPKECSVYFSDR